MIVVKIYNADNKEDFNIINNKFLNVIISNNKVGSSTIEYSDEALTNRDNGKIGIPIRKQWEDILEESLTSSEAGKVIIINNVDNPEYFPILIPKEQTK